MSEIIHDKFETCKGCPDRTVEPNCHNSCEGYKTRLEQNEEKKKQKAEALKGNIASSVLKDNYHKRLRGHK